MSNKKLFWIAFFILSCCEFGQFAYSKNNSANPQEGKLNDKSLHSHEEHILVNNTLFEKKYISHSLPR